MGRVSKRSGRELNMELIIKNIKSSADKKLLTDLAKRLGLTSAILTSYEKQDIAFGIAIEEGLKSGYVEEEIVLNTLRKKLKK